MNRNIFAMVTGLLLLAAISALAPPLTSAQQAAAPAFDDGTGKALTAIAGSATMRPRAFDYLTQVSDDIGARVTGSPEAARAVDWGVATMKEIGLDNVHAETWKISRGWTRGTADAELISPIRRRLMVDARGDGDLGRYRGFHGCRHDLRLARGRD